MNYRLIHDGVRVVSCLEARGETLTNCMVFEGTLEQCQAEAVRLGLADPDKLLPQPYELSKFIILERLIARGLGQAFLQVLASDPLTQARWDAATALDSDNPLFLAAQHQLIPALGATPAEAAQILRPGRDIP